MRFTASLTCLCLALLSACTQFPAIDRKVTPAVATAPYPSLLPFETLAAASPNAPVVDPAAALLAQGAALTAASQHLQAAP
ncbi:MAG: hypothetical protein WAT77_15735 [Paracoccaceae bacterium]|jgi:hypothetical protein